MTDRAVLAQLLLADARAAGISIDDLLAAALVAAPRVPTVAEFIEQAAGTFTPATARTYRPYWRLAVSRLGSRPISEVTLPDCLAVVEDAVARARQRRPDTAGTSSRESCITALRALLARAQQAGYARANPAAAIAKPRRGRGRRRALDDRELGEVLDAVRLTSRDPDLDLLLIRFHLESGARREGALNLTVRDIDARRATVWLREKAASEREQPVTPTLIRLLERHAASRGAIGPHDPVFRRSGGEPITRRRYNTIFDKARVRIDWSDRTPVSAHVLRHTAITAVPRLAGYTVAQAFAGHAPPSVTGQYLHATMGEVAATVATLTGEAHPLATPPRQATAAGASRGAERLAHHPARRAGPVRPRTRHVGR
jgi:integrase